MSSSASSGIPLIPSNAAPGNYLFETDSSIYAQPVSQSTLGIVVVSNSGPTVPTLITSPQQFLQTYGKPNYQNSLAPYSAMRFLNAGFPVVARRAVDSSYTNAQAIFDGALGWLNLNSNPYLGGYLNGGNGTTFTPFSPPNYAQAAKNTYIINYNTPFTDVSFEIGFSNVLTGAEAALSSISLTPSGGATDVSINQIQTALQNYLANTASTESDFTVNIYNSYSIYIVAPTGVSLLFSNLSGITTVSSTLNGATSLNEIGFSTSLFQIFANSPGSYANNTINVSISNFDLGVSQLIEIVTGTYTGDVYATYTYNGKTFTTQTVAVSPTSNTLISQIVSDINITIGFSGNPYYALGPDLFNQSVAITSGGQNYIQVGQYVAITDQNNANPIQNLQILTAAGTPAPGYSAINALNAVGSTQTFDINVYVQSTTQIAESFKVSFNYQLDSKGNQQFIENVINDPIIGSKYIGAYYNPSTIYNFYSMLGNYISSGNYITNSSTSSLYPSYSFVSQLTPLVGGNSVVSPSNSDIIAAWNDFSNTDLVSVGILVSGGYTDPSVLTTIDAIATARQDCEACLDMPSNYQSTAQEALAFRQQLLNIDSSYSSMAMPDVEVNDPYTGQNIYEPPSGWAAVKWALNDFSVGPSQASAGPTYGILNGALGLRYTYNKIDRGLLNQAGLNVIKQLKGGGIAIYGAKTLLITTSLLQFLNVRRTFTYCEQIILNYMNNIDFDNITPLLQQTTATAIKKFLTTLKNAGQIKDFQVITDSTINTTQYQDNGQFNIKTVIIPFEPAQYAVLNAVIADSIINFSEQG
jgi:hypothetical protein